MSRDNSKSSFVEGKLVEYLNKALLSQQQTEGATSNDVDELKQIGYKLKKFLYLQLYAIEKFSSAYGSDETIKRGLEIEAESPEEIAISIAGQLIAVHRNAV